MQHFVTFRIGSVFLLTVVLFVSVSYAQEFVRVTDSSNPIVSVNLEDYWTGVAWVDYDGDMDLDLFLTNRKPGIVPKRNKLFRNDGVGNFTEITSGTLVNDSGYWFGTTWADYDNDGDLDCHIAGFPSRLYKNSGDGNFTRVLSGAIAAADLGGIGTAWGDYDNDGNLDLIIVWPSWMPGSPSTGLPQPPHLFKSNGPPDYTFGKITSGAIIDGGQDAYLQPSWYDFDDDKDLDLFIGRGSGFPQPDIMYQNLLSESGTADFTILDSSAIAEEALEGQHWNFVDIDNDGDLDAFVTCWAISGPPFDPEPNILFRNDQGNFVKVTGGEIVTDEHPSVTNIWGDYDNDGDIDCIIITDSTYALNLYSNNGDGTFQKILDGDLPNTILHQSGASAGDYDEDGDLDVFVAGPAENSRLFRNETGNDKNWLKLQLVGNPSNRSGIGAVVRARAIIAGQPVWQRRDLSVANSFFGHNSLNIHFGLDNAAIIDTLIIEWPSGNIDVHSGVVSNNFYQAPEGEVLLPFTGIDQHDSGAVTPSGFQLRQNYPNPFNPATTIEFDLPAAAVVTLQIYDILGRHVETPYRASLSAGPHKYTWNATDAAGHPVASGIYYYRLQAGDQIETRKMLLAR